MLTDEQAVEAANAEFYAAFETADLGRMRNVWMDDDTTSCVHPGWRVLRGTSRIMRSWAAIFANTPYIQFFLTTSTRPCSATSRSCAASRGS